ncbi:MAG: hypothetical protein GY725_10905 [bacterium]|nr:hypothetical protein [bacterium]
MARLNSDGLCRLLLEAYAAGKDSAKDVGRIASAAWADGWRGGDGEADIAEMLAGISPTNPSRSMRRLADALGYLGTDVLYNVQVPSGRAGRTFGMDVQLPSDKLRVEIAHGRLEDYTLGDEPSARRAQLAEWKARSGCSAPVGSIVPLKFHADGVKVTRRRTVYVLDYSILAGPDSVRRKRYTFAVISSARFCRCGCGGFCTIQELMRVLVWDLHHMFRGEVSALRHDNAQLDAPRQLRRQQSRHDIPRAALLIVGGDWDWLAFCFRFRTWAQAHVCWRCGAAAEQGSPNDWRNPWDNAGWRTTRFTSMVDALQRAGGGTTSELLRAPGFAWHYIAIDVLHTFCLGVAARAQGSFLYEWVRTGSRGTIAESLLVLNRRLRDFYRHAARAEPNLSAIDVITRSTLSGATDVGVLVGVKGAECRQLVPFTCGLAREDATERPGDAGAQLRYACLSSLLGFYEAISRDEFSAAECAATTRSFCTTYRMLHDAVRAAADPTLRRLPWHLVPKFHLAQELGEYQAYELGNPRDFWAYRDESHMGSVKQVCLNTRHPRTLEEMVRVKLDMLDVLRQADAV